MLFCDGYAVGIGFGFCGRDDKIYDWVIWDDWSTDKEEGFMMTIVMMID